MYIAELDRSWLHTSLTDHEFLITQKDQITALRRYCNYVYVDPAKSEPGALNWPIMPVDANHLHAHRTAGNGHVHLEPARMALRELTTRIATTLQDARRYGRIQIAPLFKCADLLVNTISEYPDASLWLLMTENSDGLMHRRAIGTAAISSLFGKHLGFKPSALRHLALGGLLLDIGKTAIPMPILVKPNSLVPTERIFVNRHVRSSLSILGNDSEVPERVREMVLGHHERLDGSGYPQQLEGTEIPLFARIAAIADTFDALTLDRRYAVGISGHDAMRFLNSLRGEKFDDALVGEFIHALGIFPTGTCVEIMDGSLGMVCGQNHGWPLQPRIIMIRDESGHNIKPLPLLDSSHHAHITGTLPLRSLHLPPEILKQAFEQKSA